ncbi:APC family permease [Clostridium aminobutyricum]|uniref:APC family permease n=1 Tax=Clostridium aminobutyricum TaxID=33953 RepID=A0A939IGM9_CLOAM|nr:APC family permease [Clostridium aminobutyricum]MBN7772167.1 APC family permease [Clostridium aminobutyricum]
MTTENKKSFAKALGRTDVIALGFGTMVGWSWVMLAVSWLNHAGFYGTLLAFVIGAAVIGTVGLAYGELASALPLAGGEIVYVYRALGVIPAWIVGWTMTFAYIGVAAWESIAIATALDYLFPIPQVFLLWDIAGYSVYLSWTAIGCFASIIMLLLNLFGTHPAIIVQVMATAGMFIIGFIMFFGGISFGSIENIGEPFIDIKGFSYVFLMVPSMLIGFDVIPHSSEEMNLHPKNIGKTIMVCIVLAFFWYFTLIIGTAFAAPAEIRMSATMPTADVMAYAFGDEIFGKVVILSGILGILTSWNGFFMGASRLIFSLGRAKMLPPVFGQLHSKYRTPWLATLLVGSICTAAPFLGKNALVWLVNANSFCTLFSYLCVALAFLLLRKKEPNLYRPFKVKGGEFVGMVAVTISALYFIVYIPTILATDTRISMIFVAVWMLFGFTMLIYMKLKYEKTDPQEREILVFGEKYARKY